MTIWKKAISAVTSAALLASLLATAVAPAAFGALPAYRTTDLIKCTAAIVVDPDGCNQVADGISTVTLSGNISATDGTSSGYVSVAGATVVGVVAPFVLVSGTVVTAPAGATTAGSITLRAPAAAGTATVSYYTIAANGLATLDGTLTVTFTATSGLGVSEANSKVKFVAYNAACDATALAANVATKDTNPAAKMCVYVADGNSTAVTTAKVDVQITPVGLAAGALADGTVATAGTSQIASAVANVGGWYAFAIGGSGLSGTATIGVFVTLNKVTTTFAPKTFGFSGDPATITAKSIDLAVYKTGSSHAVSFTAKDTAGNLVSVAGADTVSSDTAVLVISHVDPFVYAGSKDDQGEVYVTCKKVGSANVTVKQGALASGAIKVYCSDYADSFTAAFDLPTVAAGGSAKLTVTVLDANGQPAVVGEDVDGDVSVIVSAGAITPEFAHWTDGAVVFTYLAPFNFGVATALVTVDGFDDPKSASISIGVPAKPVSLGSTAATLGATTGKGTWSTATQVTKVGSFITWRFAAGVANAGKTIGVFLQTKDANGVWSAPVRFSARVADSSGNAYFSWKGTKAMWVSIRGGLGDARSTPPVQGRWTP